mmetsp:Transcript_58431/g.167704  ORF Transcript_58431/g.167704 Transcript_58431/m.167704 type:complete len:218 (+) Transcript_58431:15-668(+)
MKRDAKQIPIATSLASSPCKNWPVIQRSERQRWRRQNRSTNVMSLRPSVARARPREAGAVRSLPFRCPEHVPPTWRATMRSACKSNAPPAASKLQRANLLHVLLVRFLLEKVRGLWSCGRGSGIVVFGKIADLVCSLADLLDDLRLLLRRGFEAQRHALRVLQTIQNAFRLHLQNVDGVHHTEAHDDLAEDGGDQWGQQVRGLLNAEAGAELANVFV